MEHQRSAMLRRMSIGLGLGGGAVVLAVGLSLTSADDALENETYDWRVAATATPAVDTRVAVIVINESSLQALDPVIGRWPWPRLAHASVIEFLTFAGARVVAYDVLFAEEDSRGTFDVGGQPFDGPLSDLALVDAVARSGRVVLAADATFEGLAADGGGPRQDLALRLPGVHYAPGPGFQPRRDVTLPFESLLAVAAGVGHTFLALDADGSARRVVPFIDVGGTALPSLGVAAALAALDAPAGDVKLEGRALAVGDRQVPMMDQPVPPLVPGDPPLPSRQALLGFRRPVVDDDEVVTIYPTYSFFDVLLSQEQRLAGLEPALDPEVFRDKVVFVGATAAGLKDVITTPFTDMGGAGGMLVHATIADNILDGRFMARARPLTDLTLAAAAGLLTGVAATTLPVTAAVVATGVLAAVVAWGATLAVGAGVWIAVVPALLASALALFGGIAWRYFVEDRAKRQVRDLFGRYVSKDVIESLLEDPAAARLGGHRREMTVLFCDIRGFTTASEAETPEAIVAQLNEYFSAMVAVLFRHDGTVDKFVGDMVMGLFGAPLDDARHADHAVAAALDMVDTLAELNDRWASAGRPVLDIGIGLNSGEMVAGNIGSESMMSYTVIGDAVNLGSRIESLNKEFGTHVLCSEATRDRLTIPVETRSIGEVTVKGRTKPVVVFEVTRRTSGVQTS